MQATLKTSVIGIGAGSIDLMKRINSCGLQNLQFILTDTAERLSKCEGYEKVVLEKETLRLLNRGFFLTSSDPICLYYKYKRNKQSGLNSKMHEVVLDWQKEIRFAVADANLIFIVIDTPGRAGAQLAKEAAFLIKWRAHRKKVVVLESRLDIYRVMGPFVHQHTGFIDIAVDFNDGKRKEAKHKKDELIFNIILECIKTGETEGLQAVTSRVVLSAISTTQIGPPVSAFLTEHSAFYGPENK